MEVVKKYFPPEIPDNEKEYFSLLQGVIESVDELSSMQISKMNDHYAFRIAPSLPKYNDMLIKELTKLHNLFKIRLDFSKSIKNSGTIAFKINL